MLRRTNFRIWFNDRRALAGKLRRDVDVDHAGPTRPNLNSNIQHARDDRSPNIRLRFTTHPRRSFDVRPAMNDIIQDALDDVSCLHFHPQNAISSSAAPI